jgi:exodeoxyribonuclease VII small subunit
MKKKTDFESQLERLQQIVQRLESGELPLEQGIELYKEGMGLVRSARQKLEQARHEVEILSRGKWEPFGSVDQDAQDDTQTD